MHSNIKQIKSTCGPVICYDNTPIEDQIKVLGIKFTGNKVLPEVIQELLCGEATAVPDMKNSPATIRFFFSDAEWNSPSSAGGVGCDTVGVSGPVPHLPVLVEPVKTTIRRNKNSFSASEFVHQMWVGRALSPSWQHPCVMAAVRSTHPPSPREVMHQSRASRKLQLHTDTEGFCSGSRSCSLDIWYWCKNLSHWRGRASEWW